VPSRPRPHQTGFRFHQHVKDVKFLAIAPSDDPVHPGTGDVHVVRGGSYIAGVGSLRTANPSAASPRSLPNPWIVGFRVAGDAPNKPDLSKSLTGRSKTSSSYVASPASRIDSGDEREQWLQLFGGKDLTGWSIDSGPGTRRDRWMVNSLSRELATIGNSAIFFRR
jgi:hypothetical protein